MWKPFALMFAAVALLATFGCSELDPANPVTGDALKADDGYGNCLSVPVIWSDDVALTLRGTFGAPEFNGEFTDVGTELDPLLAYHQKDPYNVWQASTIVPTEAVNVDFIDWGDNLESKAWPANSKIRVEVVLFEGLTEPATEFEMAWISGLGIDELWGATTVELEATQATVYSNNARLTIQKLGDNPADLTWNATLGQWEGDISPPFYNSAVFDAGDSPITKYSAEINVKGKVIYGMLWDVATDGDGPGTYRITFSLDGVNQTGLNTFFDEFTQIMVPEPEEEVTAYSPDKAEPTGGITYIDTVNNLTYIDQPITRAKGGGGGGGKPDKPGGGPGGGGGGGGHGGPN